MDISQRGLRVRVFSVSAAVAAFFLLLVPHVAWAGSEDNVFGWLWSGTVGWISLNCEQDNMNTCATQDYGVTLEDKLNPEGKVGWAEMRGWAWSENVGWICFGSTCTVAEYGLTPEGTPAYVEYRDRYRYEDEPGLQEEEKERLDQLYGWINIVGLGDEGWISLNCVNMKECGTSNYRVSLDAGAGRFYTGVDEGTGYYNSWAWGATSSAIIADWWSGAGWVDFSKAETTWTLAKLEQVLRPEGIYEAVVENPVGTHLTTFKIKFPGLYASRKCLLECDVRTSPYAGSPSGDLIKVQRVLDYTVRNGMFIAGPDQTSVISIEHAVQPDEYADLDKPWSIVACRIGGYRSLTACTTDADCGEKYVCDSPDGVAEGRCRLRLRERIRFWPVYVHPVSADSVPRHAWTIVDDGGDTSASDQFRAMECNEGKIGKYFNNATVCDFRSDVSYTLLMRRGITFEMDCADGLDNDGNGLTDCDEPYCRGISYYSCGTQEHADCVYGQGGDGLQDCDEAGYQYTDLCCTRMNKVVDGFECEYDDDVDDYHDCTDPAYQYPDLCCSEQSDVVRQPPP